MAYNLFISHAWKYDDRYQGVIRLLDSDSTFAYKDYSAPQDYPVATPERPVTTAQLKVLLENRIKPTSCFILVAGMFVNHREWVQYEIDLAKKYLKPIVAIRRRGQQVTPTYVLEIADQVVNWNSKSLITAIESVCE